MVELNLEQIKSANCMTVKDLLKFISEYNIPMDSKIMIQRVVDKYFEQTEETTITEQWGVYLKKGEPYYKALELNEKLRAEIDRRSRNENSLYPNISDPSRLIVDIEDKNLLEQYHPAFSPVSYSDDKDLLFLDLHY